MTFGILGFFQKMDEKSILETNKASFAKGQIISKGLLVSSDSSKKRKNEFGFLPDSAKNELVRSFFGRIRGYQKVLSKLSDL